MLSVTKEKIAHQFAVIEELAKDNYQEAKFYDYFGNIQLHKEKFLLLEQHNMLIFFAFRDKEKLVGYAYYLLMPSMISNAFLAENGAFFLLPQYRKGLTANRLLQEIETVLKKENIEIIIHRTQVKNDYSALFLRAGFTFQEKVFAKKI